MELLIVVGILGVLFAIAFPAMSSYLRSSRLNGASNELIADIHYARSLANVQRRSFTIVFSPTSYTLRGVNPANTVTRRTMPRGVTCSATGSALFRAWGLADPVTIRIAAGHDTSAVRLLATGNISRD